MGTYTLREKLDFQGEKTHYPYCALLQLIDLLSDKAASIFHWEERYAPKVAMYMNDLSKMTEQLGRVQIIKIVTPEDRALKERIERSKEGQTVEEESQGDSFDVLQEINTYQEVSFKTAPKSVILSKFLEEGNFQNETQSANETPTLDELAKKSVAVDESLETETLAVVFEKQGKYDKAIAIYEKLISRNPEKSSTFANRIAELRVKKENKEKE